MTPARELPRISRARLLFFRGIVRTYLRRHFRAVMLQNSERLAQAKGPLVVYANHSSWWDPMISMLLAERLLPQYAHYAPMDSAALAKYPILRKLGIFPVEMESARGAAQFLRMSESVLAQGGVLWITPQGRFADSREPLAFKPGLGALATRVPGLELLPLAIEYTFWNERLPEVLMRFGEVIEVPADLDTAAATELLRVALAAAMSDLKHAAVARDPQAFQVISEGGRGTGGVYGFMRRLKATLTGKPAELDHTPRAHSTKRDSENGS
jgi:1-acyl-sn-glycerol-3-phosphate acyltransferase